MKGAIIVGLVLLALPFASALQEIGFYGVFDQVSEYWSNGNMSITIIRQDSLSDNSGGKINNFTIYDYAGDIYDPMTWMSNFSFNYGGVNYKEISIYPDGRRSFYSSDGKAIEGELAIAFVDGTGTSFKLYDEGQLIISEDLRIVYSFKGVWANDTQRISSLESWKNGIVSWKSGIDSWKNTTDAWKVQMDSWKNSTSVWKQQIDSWKTSAQSMLTNLTSSVTNLFGITNNHGNRISALEEQEFQFNLSMSEYWGYLEFKDRERVACGFGEDNELELFKMLDLGVSCGIDYSGSKPKCDCADVQGSCNINNPLYCYSWGFKSGDLTLELLNEAGENINVMTINVTRCAFFNKKTAISEGSSKKIKIDCSENFTNGNVVIKYQKTDLVNRTVSGNIDLR
jgi:hypothetical protein